MTITLSSNGYCEVSDVQALGQQFTISANSNPSTTEVEGFITQGFAEINAMLRASGYAAPVAQAGGSLTASGTLAVDAAADAGSRVLTLTGGVSGTAQEGDYITLAGDPQQYAMTHTSRAGDDGRITVYFAPGLELDAAGSTTVTYVAGTGDAIVLKQLNAYMAAIQTTRAAYSAAGQGVGDLTAPMEAERDRLIKAIQMGQFDLPMVAVEDPGANAISNVRLVRA